MHREERSRPPRSSRASSQIGRTGSPPHRFNLPEPFASTVQHCLDRSYAASRCRAAPLIIAAPFSAIMIVGALVLVEVTAGITEASMTRSLRAPAP